MSSTRCLATFTQEYRELIGGAIATAEYPPPQLKELAIDPDAGVADRDFRLWWPARVAGDPLEPTTRTTTESRQLK